MLSWTSVETTDSARDSQYGNSW